MKIDKDFVQEKVSAYHSLHKTYVTYEKHLATIMGIVCKRLMPYAIVESRTKTIASYAEKVVRKQHKFDTVKGYDITDPCGVRVVTQTSEEKSLICDYIEKNFTIDWANSLDQKSQLSDKEFGYLAVHYIVQIPEGVTSIEGVGVPPDVVKGKHGFKAEIQVKTLLEHAWSNPLHDRLYKVAIKPPFQIKREAAGLAATLEHADERLMSVAGDIDSYLGHYEAYMDHDRLQDEIDILKVAVEYETDLSKQAALRLKLGRFYKLNNDVGAAQAQWETVADVDSSCHDAIRLELGTLLCERHRRSGVQTIHGDGEKMLRGVMQHRVSDQDVESHDAIRTRAEAAARLGREYSRLSGQDVEARACFQRAFELDPANPYHLSDFLSFEMICEQKPVIKRSMVPYIEQAIAVCRKHVTVGIEQPRAQLTMGRLHLLIDDLPGAMDAYLKAVRVLLKLSVHRSIEAIDDEARFIQAIRMGQELSDEHRQVRQLLLLARAARHRQQGQPVDLQEAVSDEESLKELGSPRRTLIIAGGAESMPKEVTEKHKNVVSWALEHTDGLVCSGGTRVGIPGLVGDVAEELNKQQTKRFDLVGYVPERYSEESSPDRDRYDAIIKTGGLDFSPLEPIQHWVDMSHLGWKPGDVRVLGIGGGDIAAIEYRLALALGAKVAVVPGSGGAVDRLLADPEWADDADLVALHEEVHDPSTLRAFVRPATDDIEDIEKLAEIVHENYLKSSPYSAIDPSRAKYVDLRDDLKESNRQQVLYAREILASEGYVLKAVADKDQIVMPEFDEDEIARMAELEHGRWNVERLAEGWKPSKEDTKNFKHMTHPSLICWEELPEDIKRYDFDAIKNYAVVLKEAGYQIVKKGSAGDG